MSQQALSDSTDNITIDGEKPIIQEPVAPVEETKEWTDIVDKDLVILALMKGLIWDKKIRNPGYKTIFYYDPILLKPILEVWQNPEPIMVDFRQVISATRIFNSAVHEG